MDEKRPGLVLSLFPGLGVLDKVQAAPSGSMAHLTRQPRLRPAPGLRSGFLPSGRAAPCS